MRGDRSVAFLDTNTVEWIPSATGLSRRYLLSRDPVSGGFTNALWLAKQVADEHPHYAETDMEIFCFDGDWSFDEHFAMTPGDYLYRPAGTVYGHNEHSDQSGTIIVSFARDARRFHFEEIPDPWPGEFLVDHAWNPRPIQPLAVKSAEIPWVDSKLGEGIQEKRYRGTPGTIGTAGTASSNAPWTAESAFLIRFPAGFRGAVSWWPDTIVELLATAGNATIGGDAWRRGCYAFGIAETRIDVEADLVCYGRTFRTSSE